MEMTFWLPQAEAALAQVEGCNGLRAILVEVLACSGSGRPTSHCVGAIAEVLGDGICR